MVIKPDTSMYGKMPERLCALAAGMGRGEGELLEERDPRTGAWELANGTAAVLVTRLAQGWDFRIKPKPRELWVVHDGNGKFIACSEIESVAVAMSQVAFDSRRTVTRYAPAA